MENDKMIIKEVIVVEGRDDVTAIKRAVDAEIIAVGGFGINSKVISQIKEAHKRKGIIVLTDPDFAGEKIRGIISKRIPNAKHAYIARRDGTKGDDIGVENATPDVIIKALNSAKCELTEKRNFFNIEDMLYFKLSSDPKAKDRRELLGKELGIGYANTAKFIMKLNNFGITREEFIEAVNKIDKEI